MHRTRNAVSSVSSYSVLSLEKTDLAKAIQTVNWKKGPHWNGIAMVGDRFNNTGPGVRATAGYVLHKAGFAGEEGTNIGDLLEAFRRTESALVKAA
jgi:hypothetical protein